jgi:formylglycine-generating enzyme required for sulfatase activity
VSRFRVGDRPLRGIDWELVELLGAGGFGEVWKARNPHFDGVPPVALKFCLEPAAKDRLLRHEAAILNQVMRQGKHPGIVPLQHTYLSADPPCLEYEFVPGGNLGVVIREWHRRPPGPDLVERAARLILELAGIMGFAHRLSPAIVHRDLKPANILVQEDAEGTLRLRVADFGIGGLAAGEAIDRTRAGVDPAQFLVTALRGAHTPLYASPQQMSGGPPHPTDDVYSIGVIWYQALIGELTAHRPGGTRWVRRLGERGMSAEMIELLGSCVEGEAADRPADAAVLARELAALLDRASPAPVAARRAVPGPRPRHSTARETRPTRRPRTLPDPRDLPQQLTNSLGMRLVLISAGRFRMGSPDAEPGRGADEGPQHPVHISRPFYIGIYPVTQREYEAAMGRNPAHFSRANGGGPAHPVEQVSWEDAVAFCRRLAGLAAEKRAGRSYRLPTEAEWEYACRAGTTTPFWNGDALSSEHATFDGSHPYGKAERGPYLQKTTKVGCYAANPWGLFDAHGNVWEWCADRYDERYYERSPEADPQGPSRGDRHLVRGGSWNNSGHLCRSARRNKHAADFRSEHLGFRVVLDV